MTEKLANLSDERIAYLEGLVRQGKTAAAIFTQFSQEDVDAIVKAMVLAGLDQAQYLAGLAIEETRLGVLEDKAIKNMVATEFVYNYVRDKRSVGVIREFPERGLLEVAEPIGLIFSVTRLLTRLNGAVQMHHGHQDAKRRHFRTHPKAWRCCRRPYGSCTGRGEARRPRGVFTCLNRPPYRTTTT